MPGMQESPIWKSPNLSELIEACGDEIEAIHREAKGWVAVETLFNSSGNVFPYQVGASTPEEAVANLWLKLNENK